MAQQLHHVQIAFHGVCHHDKFQEANMLIAHSQLIRQHHEDRLIPYKNYYQISRQHEAVS